MKFTDEAYKGYLGIVQNAASETNTRTNWKYTSKGHFEGRKGFGYCLAFDPEDGVIKAWASKNKNFDSVKDTATQKEQLAESAAETSYLICAYKIDLDSDQIDVALEDIKDKMESFDSDLSKRSGHYRYNGVTFSQFPEINHEADALKYGQDQHLLFNVKGYSAYKIDSHNNAQWCLSPRRNNGSFVPLSFDRSLFKGVSCVSTKISASGDFNRAIQDVDAHRRQESWLAWEQKNLFKGGDVSFLMRGYSAASLNYAYSFPKKAPEILAVSALLYPFSSEAAFVVLGATAAHHLASESVQKAQHFSGEVWLRTRYHIGYDALKKAPTRQDIKKEYLKGGHNLWKETENLRKEAPKASEFAMKPQKNEYLPIDIIERLAEKLTAKRVETLENDSLKDFLMKIHQLNLPGKQYQVDRHCYGFEMDNSVAGFRYRNPNSRTVTIIAELNNDLNTELLLDLPPMLKERMRECERGFFKFECEVIEGEINVISEGRSLGRDAVLKDIESLLFKHQAFMPDYVRDRSMQTMHEIFPTDDDKKRMHAFRRSGVKTFPFAEAAMSKEEIKKYTTLPTSDEMRRLRIMGLGMKIEDMKIGDIGIEGVDFHPDPPITLPEPDEIGDVDGFERIEPSF